MRVFLYTKKDISTVKNAGNVVCTLKKDPSPHLTCLAHFLKNLKTFTSIDFIEIDVY